MSSDRAPLAYRDPKHVRICDKSLGIPFSNDAQATLTDYYQITMAYAYWRTGKHDLPSVFDVSFRKAPFGGSFAILAGVEEVMRLVNTFSFSEEDVAFLRTQLPAADGFFDFLRTLSGKEVKVYSMQEGSLIFPHEPVMRIEGPLAICQLLETPILNLTNFPSLIATNAARHRLVAGWNKTLIEFGVRRAQGPDGAVTATRYSYMGSFDATSNVRAGLLFNIPLRGTHAHALVSAFTGLDDVRRCVLRYGKTADPPFIGPSPATLLQVGTDGKPKRLSDGPEFVCEDFLERVLKCRSKLEDVWPDANLRSVMNESELAAFVAYAATFPDGCLCLVDTYDTLASGVPNFLCVALALHDLGFQPIGVRLDSGDLAYLSRETRRIFREVAVKLDVPSFENLHIVASNDLNEKVIQALNEQGHSVDTFGIGTNLVTCQAQPALGMIYKLAEIGSEPRMKLSQEISKATLPGRKAVYRLYASEGPILDLIQLADAKPPEAGQKIFCKHLTDDSKRCYVVPSRVENLLTLYWNGSGCRANGDLHAKRRRCMEQLKMFRRDFLRPVNPAIYKVSASQEYHNFFKDMWNATAPIFTLL